MANLVLIRHGESEWNAKGLWTGLNDVSLNKNGEKEAQEAADVLKDYHFDYIFLSKLKRAKETYEIIKKINQLDNIPVIEDSALNERDYGIYAGKNKWEIKKELGDEEFLKIRRSWNHPIPKGESLEDVYNRVVPYFKSEILPKLKEQKNVLAVAHGNSLRALIKYLENISDEDIPKLEMATGEVYIYEIDKNGKVISKEIKGSHPNNV